MFRHTLKYSTLNRYLPEFCTRLTKDRVVWDVFITKSEYLTLDRYLPDICSRWKKVDRVMWDVFITKTVEALLSICGSNI